MKVLFTHRYFWPDTPPYAAMLRSIAEDFAKSGHEVEVFCSIPSYRGSEKSPRRETLNGVNIRRIWVFGEKSGGPLPRVLNVLLYCMGLFFYILRARPDVVTAATFPPVIAAWVASLAARLIGAKFIYHMQDVHPEVSQFSGGIMGKGVVGKFFRWLDNQSLRRAHAIIVLSADMKNTLERRGISDLPIVIINNFLLDSFTNEAVPPKGLSKSESKMRAVFAGNMGKFQNVEALSEAIVNCFEDFPDLELLLLGDGSCLPALKSRWADQDRVIFSPFLPFEQAKILIEEADLGLVSLQKDIYHTSYPSKVLTYLGLGLPLLVAVEPESELAKTVETDRLGVVPKNDSVAAIEAAMRRFLQSGIKRKDILEYYQENLDKSSALERWNELLH